MVWERDHTMYFFFSKHCSGKDIQDPQSPHTIASFPGYSHLQYFIACSMKMQSGEAWEIWSHVMTSCRHMGGGARPRISKPFLVMSVTGLEAKSICRQCQNNWLFTTPGDWSNV